MRGKERYSQTKGVLQSEAGTCAVPGMSRGHQDRSVVVLGENSTEIKAGKESEVVTRARSQKA